MSFRIIKLNPNNKKHIQFTYKMLQERERIKNKCCITNFILPTIKQHKSLLKKFPFICYYLLFYKNISYGIQYINKKYRYAIYYHPEQLREIIKKYKNDAEIKDKSKRLYVWKELLRRHPEIKHLTAEININNTSSLNGALELGFKPSHTVLYFKR